MTPMRMLEDQDLFALRIGRAMVRRQVELAAAISFKAGCAVVAPMFADVLEVTSLVLSVVTEQPAITLHVDWRLGVGPRVIDSREVGFSEAVPEICEREPHWETVFPDRMRVQVRSCDPIPERVGGLEVIATLLLPFHELTRRTERLNQATSLLEVALNAVATRDADGVYREIVRRVGESVRAPAAFYPALDGYLPGSADAVHIYANGLPEQIAQHLFISLGQFTDGPVQRAMASRAGAAPTTPASLGYGPDAERINAMLAQLRISDYVALRVAHEDQPIGAIVVVAMQPDGDTTPPAGLTQSDIATVASAGFIAGWAIPLAQQQRRLRRSLQESEMLRHLAQVSYQHRDQNETLSMASGVARIIFGADYVAMATISEDGRPTGFGHVTGNRTDAHLRKSEFPLSERMRAWLANPTTIAIENVAEETDLDPQDMLIHHEEELVSSLTVPFERSDGGWSFLLIGFRERQTLGADDVRFAQALAQTIASAV
jgi:hypothetical protein